MQRNKALGGRIATKPAGININVVTHLSSIIIKCIVIANHMVMSVKVLGKYPIHTPLFTIVEVLL